MVMMSLLTLMAMFGGVRQNTPKVKKKKLLKKKVKKKILLYVISLDRTITDLILPNDDNKRIN
jgi:hypothetical protein